MKTQSLGYTNMFRFFDTNEIHIQAFVDFIHGKLIIFRSSSPENIFKIYIQKIYTKIDPKNISNTYIQKTNSKNVGLPFEHFRNV